MRVTLIAVVTIAIAAPAGAAAGLQPPVIKEPFTLLPCPAHPKTTLAREGCYEQAILKTDRAINTNVKAIFGRLSAAARVSFVQGEKSWLGYRRASCTTEASVYAGGSEEPVAFAACEAARNRTHLTDLAELRRTL